MNVSRIIVGAGNYKYEVIWPWGQLPAGTCLGNVSHVAVDSKDRIYVYQRDSPPLLVLDADGMLLKSWGEDLLVDGHGIFITPRDEVFLVARGVHEVIKFDTAGNVQLRIGNRERPSFQAPFNHPTDVAVSPSGEIYITDGYGNAMVHKFSPEGTLLHSWGAPGSGPGEFSTPHGIWIDARNRVYVADRENNRIQLFDSNGSYLTEWRNFYHPMDIFMDAAGTVYVTDQTPRLTVLNIDGKLLARGFAPDAGHGIYGDSAGNLFLAGLQRGVVKLVRQ
jgi:peptidylglycine monooxygenase